MARKKKQSIQTNIGLGDLIDEVTTKTGIKKVVKTIAKDCGCKERVKKLNNIIQLPRTIRVKNCFKDEDKIWFEKYKLTRTLTHVNFKDVRKLIDIYAHVFGIKYDKESLCSGCVGTAKIINTIDERLSKVYDIVND